MSPTPVAEDVPEADEDGQMDPAQQQMIDELLQIDGSGRVLGRVDEDVAGGRDGEVALAPAVDFIELGSVGDGE